MIKEITLPKVSENVEQGDVVKVLVRVGDAVEVDQSIIELETDKALFEVPSSEKGKVVEINVKEGETIKVGQVIVKIETDFEKSEVGGQKAEVKNEKESEVGGQKAEVKKEKESEVGGQKAEVKKEKESEVGGQKAEVKKEKDSEVGGQKAEVKNEKESEVRGEKVEVKEERKEELQRRDGAEEEDKIKRAEVKDERGEGKEERKEKETAGIEEKREEKEAPPKAAEPKEPAPAAPSVRRLAREIGIDINEVHGSGSAGRITEDDVKAFAKQLLSTPQAAVGAAGYKPLPDFSKWGEIKREPMPKIRQVTAENMFYAWSTVAQVTQFDEADITDLEKFRKDYNERVKDEKGHLTVTAILVKVISSALKEFPQFNASIDMNRKEIIYKKYINIGIAVDTDRGLLVPVIKNADKKSLNDLPLELTELSEKSRNKRITLEEMEGGNFTISNLGGIGGTNFSPIVYAPQAAILGVSHATTEAKYINGKLEPRFILPLSLSYDHKLIDGADAARFLRWVCKALENPLLLIL